VNSCGGDSGSLWAVNGAVQSLRVTVSISIEDWVEDFLGIFAWLSTQQCHDHLCENYGDD
jgi:hypothetical protein